MSLENMTDDEWLIVCEASETLYPELHEFLDTWVANCGASRDVFRVHLVKMVFSIITKYIDNIELSHQELIEIVSSIPYDKVFGDSLAAAIEAQTKTVNSIKYR